MVFTAALSSAFVLGFKFVQRLYPPIRFRWKTIVAQSLGV